MRLMPMYWVRALGGTLYIVGMVLFGYNILMTWRRAGPRTRSRWSRPRRWRRRLPTEPAAPATGRCAAPVRRRRALAPALGGDCRSPSRCGRGRGDRRLAVRDHPDVPDPLERADHRLGQAVHAARAGGARPLHPRGLLQLPLADDPAASATRPSATASTPSPASSSTTTVPVGLPPHRPRPGARGREVPRPLARAAHRESARDRRRARSCRPTRGC